MQAVTVHSVGVVTIHIRKYSSLILKSASPIGTSVKAFSGTVGRQELIGMT